MDARTIVLMAFVFITVITALAVLAAAVGWLPGHEPRLVSWGIPAVLGEIVLTVVVFFKGQWAQAIRINVVFERTDAADIDLDRSNCRFAIYDASGKVVKEDNVGPSIGPGGWQVQLPGVVQEDHSVRLELQSEDGQTWNVRPFRPFVQTQTAYRTRA